MKKFSLVIIMLAVSVAAGAQGIEDALRYSQQFYVGSARTMAMGNAFTALGGDLGALGINPASSAMYNCCEFAITGGLSWDNARSQFEGSEELTSQKVGKTKFTVPNVAAIFSVPTGRDYGLVNYTFGFGLNKTSNFLSRVAFGGWDGNTSLLGNLADGLEGVDNSYLQAENAFYEGYCTPQEILAWDTYLVNPYKNFTDSYIGATENEWGESSLGVENPLNKSYDLTTSGGIYDMQFNFGTNFNDRLYLGANVNIKMVEYEENLWYGEQAAKGDWYDKGFQSMEYNHWMRTSGVGVNLQLGAIWVPFDFVRLGVSYTTPTVLELTDNVYEYMASSFDGSNPDVKTSTSETPQDLFYRYRVKTPSRFSVGAAFVFGREGLLSADIEHVSYNKMVLSDSNHNESTFSDVNDDIAKYCYNGTIIRLGGELNVLNDVALRAGYNCYKFDTPVYHYISFGIGKRLSEHSSVDLAFRTRLKDTYEMLPYNDYGWDAAGNASCLAPLATITNTAGDLMLTYRVKF